MTVIRSLVAAGIGAVAALGATLGTATPAKAWCGYYGCGPRYYYGPSDAAIAAGVIGGLALGAIAASAAYDAHQAELRRAAYARRVAYRRPVRVRVVAY